MEIIKEEFIKKDFQVIISTYDREWFELARHWLATNKIKSKSIELFIEDDGNPNTPDFPIIIPYDGNFAKAEAYFKSKDYPSSGNYLRKECESIIKTLLPETYKIDNSGNIIEELEGLLQELDKLYEDSSLSKPTQLTDAIKIYRKALLNPSSHDDNKSPLFRREIQDAFEIVKKLKELTPITRTLVFHNGDVFTYKNDDANYIVELELADNLFRVVQGETKILSSHKFRVKKWSWNGIDYATNVAGSVMAEAQRIEYCDQKRKLSDIFSAIHTSIGIEIPANQNSALTIGATGTLADVLV